MAIKTIRVSIYQNFGFAGTESSWTEELSYNDEEDTEKTAIDYYAQELFESMTEQLDCSVTKISNDDEDEEE